MKIFVVDNYDSFTFNIVELLRQFNDIEFSIYKNDAIPFDRVRLFDKVIISPGPATPKESGALMSFISEFHNKIPMLGICLGHQALAEFFGAKLKNLQMPFHGYHTTIKIIGQHKIFSKINEEEMKVGLYHSWIVSQDSFPSCLDVTSYSKENHIMSFKHSKYDLHGIQFHPESYMTDKGKYILEGFIN